MGAVKKRTVLIILILILAFLLRIYRFADTLQLDADQAMAYILADRIINLNHNLMIGPITSLKDINILAPTYYYLISFLFLIFRKEITISFVLLLANLSGIYLIYLATKQIANAKSGLLSALFFSLSSTMIIYSRNIWEPHLAPFFVILSIFLLLSAYKSKSTIFLFLSVITFFFSLMYVSSFLLLPVYLYLTYKISRYINKKTGFLNIYLFYYFSFFLFYKNSLIFEFRNNFPSVSAFLKSFNANFLTSPAIYVYFETVIHNLKRFNETITNIDNYLILLFILIIFIFPFPDNIKHLKNRKMIKIISFAVLFSFLLAGLYKLQIRPYRFASIYPLFFILMGFTIYKLTSFKNADILMKIGGTCSIFFVMLYLISNMKQYKFYLTNTNLFNYKQVEKYTDKLISESNNKPFNLYVIKYRGSPKIEHENFELTPFAWMLEKKLNARFFNLNRNGNWIQRDFRFNRPVLLLACLEFEEKAYEYCYRYVMQKEKLTGIDYRISILDQMTLFKISKI